MTEILPIERLITSRIEQFGMTAAEFIRRCGYQNVSKGRRRLDQLYRGEFDKAWTILRALPAVLDIPAEEVREAIELGQRQLLEAEEAAYRAAFKPHAIIETERKIPQPIFVAVFCGGEKLIRVDFDLSLPPISYVQQAREGIAAKLRQWNSESIPAFGRAVGFVVNYSPDHAVRFDLEGRPIETLLEALGSGRMFVRIGGRTLSPEQLSRLLQVRIGSGP